MRSQGRPRTFTFDLHESHQSPGLPSQTRKTSPVTFPNFSVVCVCVSPSFAQTDNLTGEQTNNDNLNENKAIDLIPQEKRCKSFPFFYFRLAVLNYRCSLIGRGQIKSA